MLNVFLSIMPIFSLIFLGYGVKKFFITDDTFWKASDKLVYYLFFPSLLILEISNANFALKNTSLSLIATVGATLGVAILIFVIQIIIKTPNKLFTSIFQGGVRYNSYVFIAMAQSLFGPEGTALSGVFIAYMIVLTNIMSVLVMNFYGEGNKKHFKNIFSALWKNPLIISALIGIILNVLNIHITSALKQCMTYIGHAATPLSLMSVGAGLMLKMEIQKIAATMYSITLKLIIMPIMTFFLLKAQGASGIEASIALLYASVPCAGNAYILARQMGGDSEAMAAIITWATLLSALSITVIMGYRI